MWEIYAHALVKYKFDSLPSWVRKLPVASSLYIYVNNGIDIENGFSTYYGEEAGVDKMMMERADVCIIAADRTKLRRNAFVKISDINSADCIVTTGTVTDKEKTLFETSGVDVIVAE